MKKVNNKILSIIIAVRNDDYYINLLDRINYSLEYNSWIINKLGLKNFIDLIVVDWGSEKKISNELIFSSNSRGIIKFYEISKSIALKEGDPSASYFNIPGTSLKAGNLSFPTMHNILKYDAN